MLNKNRRVDPYPVDPFRNLTSLSFLIEKKQMFKSKDSDMDIVMVSERMFGASDIEFISLLFLHFLHHPTLCCHRRDNRNVRRGEFI